MVEWKHEGQIGESEVDNGAKCDGHDNNGLECDDYTSDSSLSSIDYDENLTTDGNGGTLASVQNNESSNFGNIAVKNSTDIHFGNKTFYHGPVTIKQVVYASGNDENKINGDLLAAVTNTVDLSQLKTNAEPNAHIQLEKGKTENGNIWICEKSRFQCLVWMVSLVVATVITMTTVLYVLTNQTDIGSQIPVSSNSKYPREDAYNQPRTKYNVTLSGKLRILSRKDWLAQPAVGERDNLAQPVPYVIISHTATESCTSQAECTYVVRTMQTFHIESKGWDDIAYNFIIGGDGYVYAGRGWDYVGAHSYGYNICSIGISFIGTFIEVRPTPDQLLAVEQLIDEGVQLGKIRKDYRLMGHRQVSATESPGQAFFDYIETLPHWTDNPISCAKIANETNIVPNKN